MKKYIQHCEIQKRFGTKEGSDFIRLLNHVSKTGKGKLDGGIPEIKLEHLSQLFRDIIYYEEKKEENWEIWDSCSSRAKKYLIDKKADSSKKYLFTAGQILDHKGDGKWWDYKKKKLIYIGPESEEITVTDNGYQFRGPKPFLPKEYGRIVTFQDIINKASDIRFSITDSDLVKYWEWVVEVLRKIPNN